MRDYAGLHQSAPLPGVSTVVNSVAPRYLTVGQCAAYLGRTPKAVYRLVEREEIPHLRIGRRVQFDKDRVDRWLERHTVRGAGEYA